MTETTEHEQQGPSAEAAGSKPDPVQEKTAGGEYVEVYVRPEDMQSTAQALLEAAGDDVDRVETVSGGFWVPQAVAESAGIAPTDDRTVDPEQTGDQEAREGSGRVVSADEIIAADLASGAASPQAVGAVFASNSPTGTDVAEQDTGRGEPAGQAGQPETAEGQQAEQQAPAQEKTEAPAGQTGEQETPAGESEEPETGSAPVGKGRRRTGEPRTAGGDGR